MPRAARQALRNEVRRVPRHLGTVQGHEVRSRGGELEMPVMPHTTCEALLLQLHGVPQDERPVRADEVQPPECRGAQLAPDRVCEVPPEQLLEGVLHLPQRKTTAGRLGMPARANGRSNVRAACGRLRRAW